MKYTTTLLSLFFLLPFLGYAQETYPTGLILDDEAYDRLPHSSENVQLDYGRKSLTSKVDLSPYCPEVGHQGDMASCVGWAAGYAAMTIERAIQNGWTDKRQISEQANSALFVYNQISKGNCDLGITMSEGLDLLRQRGNCLARDFDHNVDDCREKVSESLVKKAAAYRIQDYLPLFKSDAAPEEKVRKVRLALAQQRPVIIGMRIRQNFYKVRPGESDWKPNIGDTTHARGHAMVVVGYDDNRFTRANWDNPRSLEGAFKVMNSWGKNWGERGFAWIRYAHFAEFCRHAYVISMGKGAPIDLNMDTAPQIVAESTSLKSMAGTFGFRQFTGYGGDDIPDFKEAPVRLINGSYVLEGDHKIGDRFQLYVESDFDNGYIYVFSVDARGKAEIHFPKSEEYNRKFRGRQESALLLSSGSILTIPAIDSVLKLTQEGKDHLVVMFSTHKIKPDYIAFLCEELPKHKAELQKRLLQLLEKHLVPLADITYRQNRMGFEVSTRSEGKIVPIVLTVDVLAE